MANVVGHATQKIYKVFDLLEECSRPRHLSDHDIFNNVSRIKMIRNVFKSRISEFQLQQVVGEYKRRFY